MFESAVTENKFSRREFINSAAKATGAGLGAMILSARAVAAAKETPPSDRITIGIIGVGARSYPLISAIRAIEDVEIVKVCDAYTGRITRALEELGKEVKVAGHYREIIEDGGIDVAVIVTPDHWHKQMVIEAVGAGKDVYIEKPLTYTVDEGLEIINAVDRSKQIVQVGSQHISSPVFQTAKKIIDSGQLGQITMIRAYYNRNTAEGAWIYPIPPDASKKTVNWEQFLGSAPQVPFSLERFFRWRCYKDYSGGIPTDLFVHLCTSIHYLMGVEDPAHVMAMGKLYRWKNSRNVPDTVNASLEYKEGFMVNISSTFNNTMTAGAGYQILGTEGSLEISPSNLTFIPDTPIENAHWVVRSWPKALEQAYYADPEIVAMETAAKAKKDASKAWKVMENYSIDATRFHMKHFIDCVRTRSQPLEDVRVGHRAAAVAHMVNRSLERREEVNWDFQNMKIAT